ncbi:DUF1574 family protein [Dolichospermum circinale CS-545/17]|nr:DUF1574 family protein [Dolichospermum circinale CS-545/17]
MKTVLFKLFNPQQFLAPSTSHVININTYVTKVKLLDNDLYILHESVECSQGWQNLLELLQPLEESNVDSLTNDHQSSRYQVLVYGRKQGEDIPQWCYRLYLNQLHQHLEQVEKSLFAGTETPTDLDGSLMITDESLAHQKDTKLDWLSHLNLTPSEVMLKPWDDWGNVPAIARILKTSAIQVMLIPTEDLLDIICDHPICPTLYQVSRKFTQFIIRELQISAISGFSIDVRRPADKELMWFHGLNMVERSRLVPAETLKFAAISEYVSYQITDQTREPILCPNSRSEQVQNLGKKIGKNWAARLNKKINQLLLNSQLFITFNQDTNQNLDHKDHKGIGGGMIWLGLGLLLALQSDLILSYILARSLKSYPQVSVSNNIVSPLPLVSQPSLPGENNQTRPVSNQSVTPKSLNHNQSTFNASGFINDHDTNFPVAPLTENAAATAILLTARSQMPSFNARQLDEQLALYKQRLAMKKRPPDVLIVGSSRALRGVDPLALSRALVSQGHSNLDIFNFGINGATAQVVDCLIRQILEPEELPKLILWADGSRAFNNGRQDITFNAIAVSQGYKQILQKTRTRVNTDAVNKNKEGFLVNITNKSARKDINIYQVADSWLNESLSGLSASYKNREQIKTLLQKKFENIPFSYQYPQVKSQVKLTSYSAITNSLQGVDFDGFLPISVRFNPATYYQKYPKVSGDYDNDYKSFQLAGKQDQAFRSVLEFTKKNNISLVFVNMPLTLDYLDPVRTKYEQQFHKHLLKFTSDPHFIYRDLSQLWPTASNYFSDPSHINRYGAYEVSKKLALDPIISWTKK